MQFVVHAERLNIRRTSKTEARSCDDLMLLARLESLELARVAREEYCSG